MSQDIAFLSGKVVKTGKSTHHEAYNKYSHKWYDSYFFPYAKGQVGILFRDITERKKAEEALKESEEKFQNMIDQSPVVFELYDKNGVLVQVNPAWDKLWQIPREYAIGKYNILQSKQISEIGYLQLVKRAYAGETVVVPETMFDASLEPEAFGKGRKRWLSSVIYPIKNVSDEVNRIVIMHEDITRIRCWRNSFRIKSVWRLLVRLLVWLGMICVTRCRQSLAKCTWRKVNWIYAG